MIGEILCMFDCVSYIYNVIEEMCDRTFVEHEWLCDILINRWVVMYDWLCDLFYDLRSV